MRRLKFSVFHLDYLSCALTVLATVLIGRKLWIGLVLAAINSAIVCLIGLKTSQFGFIPANLFCIGVYAVSIRSWLRKEKPAAPVMPEAGAMPEMQPVEQPAA